ncbi:hypothetical protein ACFQZ4_08360 [Catellatospora coxensis]
MARAKRSPEGIPDGLRFALADVALGQQRPQQRGQLRPRRAPGQREQRHARVVGGLPEFGGQRQRCTQHERGRVVPAQAVQQGCDLGRFAQADAEHQGALRKHGLFERVVDGDAADVAAAVRVAVHQFEQRRAEVVEHAAEGGLGTQVQLHGG